MKKQFLSWVLGALVLLLNGCQEASAPASTTGLVSLPTAISGITFSNTLSPDESFNIIEYLYYYNGGGVAVGDLNNDGLADLFFTGNQLGNQLYFNEGNLRFSDQTKAAGILQDGTWSTGVTMADVNADGWLDIYVCQVGDYKVCQGQNQLFINNQDGTFSERAAEFGLAFKGFSTQAAFFDYDSDGDLDMYLLNHSVHSTENYGQSTVRLRRDSLGGDRLYRNEAGYFEDVSAEAGIYGSRIGYGLGIGIADLNQDGCPDIYVSNDFHENDYLYYNNCDGTFTEGIRESIQHSSTFSMGNDLADVNNDGLIDLLSLDMKPADEQIAKSSVGAEPYNIYQLKRRFGYYDQYPRNMLQLNQGKLRQGQATQFSESAYLAGIDATDWSWAPLFCDLNNDGWKDLFVGNGIWQRPNDLDYLKFISNQQLNAAATDLELSAEMPDGSIENFVFLNQQDGTFQNVSQDWGQAQKTCSTGAAYADLDLDGDLDLILNNINAPASILENRGANANSLRIQLKGTAQNPFGIGAKVFLQSESNPQVQEIYTTRGFQSSVPPVAHFGLGTTTDATGVQIRWPNGSWQAVALAHLDTMLLIEYAPNMNPPQTDQASPMLQRANWRLDFLHQENGFSDFDVEKLMPFSHARLGPAMAVGDLTGDGLDDIYLGGAKGAPGMYFVQSEDGIFMPQDPAIFERFAYIEETAATCFDADGDGDLDLYIAGGGSEQMIGLNSFLDRLYLNDGAGNLSLSANALPTGFAINGSCAVPLDYDGDGALDLFLGGYTVVGAYGMVPKSAVLRNKGNGEFEEVSAAVLERTELGMVTAALALDQTTLAVVGEWMPLTLLSWDGERFAQTTVPDSEGWWQSIATIDLEQDGQLELLLGNFGENTDLHPSADQPVELFVGDFDQNRFADPIMTYYKQDRQYTYFGRDLLEQQLVRLKKGEVGYSRFAQFTFRENFDQIDLKDAVQHQAKTFSSAVAKRQGKRWVLQPLAQAAQMAPICAFTTLDIDGDGDEDVLSAGNITAVQPAIGKLDASYGLVLENDGRGNLIPLSPQQSGFIVFGESRQLSTILTANGQPLIIVGRNNTTTQIFEQALITQ
ncbi:MAG: CRTAC1 family protein [Bacteroidota bacterium]